MVITSAGGPADGAAAGEVDRPGRGSSRIGLTSWATITTVTSSLAADARDQRGDGGLVGQVEAVQRLVQQQQPGPRGERLRDQQPLLLAAGELADRPVGVGGGADQVDHLVDPRAPRSRGRWSAPRRQRDAPAGAVETEPDDVDAADPQPRVEAAPLGQVADLARCASPGGSPSTLSAAGGQRQQAEHDLDQRRLPDAVRPEHGDELAAARRSGRRRSRCVRPPTATAASLTSSQDGLSASSSGVACRQCGPQRAAAAPSATAGSGAWPA